MGMVRTLWPRAVAPVLLTFLSLGCSRVGCNKMPRSNAPLSDAGPPPAIEQVTVNAPTNPETLPLWLVAMRERRWADATRHLALLNAGVQSDAKTSLAYAYALAKDANLLRHF